MVCEATDKEAGVAFTDAFMQQLHRADTLLLTFLLLRQLQPLQYVARATTERSIMCVAQLCWDMPCSVALHRKAEKLVKAQSPSSSEKMHVYPKPRVIIFSTLLFCDSFC